MTTSQALDRMHELCRLNASGEVTAYTAGTEIMRLLRIHLEELMSAVNEDTE